LVEIEARLSQTARFNEAELRSLALLRAVDERKNRLATLEERIKSYEAPLQLVIRAFMYPSFEINKSDFI